MNKITIDFIEKLQFSWAFGHKKEISLHIQAIKS